MERLVSCLCSRRGLSGRSSRQRIRRRVSENPRPSWNCLELTYQCSCPPRSRPRLRDARRHRQGQGRLSRFPHALERRRPRYSHFEASKGGICEIAVTFFSRSRQRLGFGLRIFPTKWVQQVIAEVGATAATFPSEKHLSSWVGACPGDEESAEVNRSRRSPQGNRHMRRILNQAANAAVKHKGSIFEILYRRYVPRLGHNQTIGIIAHKLCRLVWKILHRGIRCEERGPEVSKA